MIFLFFLWQENSWSYASLVVYVRQSNTFLIPSALECIFIFGLLIMLILYTETDVGIETIQNLDINLAFPRLFIESYTILYKLNYTKLIDEICQLL